MLNLKTLFRNLYGSKLNYRQSWFSISQTRYRCWSCRHNWINLLETRVWLKVWGPFVKNTCILLYSYSSQIINAHNINYWHRLKIYSYHIRPSKRYSPYKNSVFYWHPIFKIIFYHTIYKTSNENVHHPVLNTHSQYVTEQKICSADSYGNML